MSDPIQTLIGSALSIAMSPPDPDRLADARAVVARRAAEATAYARSPDCPGGAEVRRAVATAERVSLAALDGGAAVRRADLLDAARNLSRVAPPPPSGPDADRRLIAEQARTCAAEVYGVNSPYGFNERVAERLVEVFWDRVRGLEGRTGLPLLEVPDEPERVPTDAACRNALYRLANWTEATPRMSRVMNRGECARRFGVSARRLTELLSRLSVRYQEIDRQSIRVAVDDIPPAE